VVRFLKIAVPVVLLLGLVGAGVVYLFAFAPNTPTYEADETFRGVKIPPGAGFEATTDSLVNAGIIADAGRFETFGDVTGWGRQVKPGYYRFEAGASNWDVLDKIRKGLQDYVRFTVPPGTRPSVLAAVWRRDFGMDSAAVHQALLSDSLARALGTDTAHLFGRMRPNSYDAYWTTGIEPLIRKVNNEMERFFDQNGRREKAEALGLTPDEVITMASIVEWEARQPEERPRIAGVYLNRLLARKGRRMRLEADPTVQYALMQVEGGLMRRLLFKDYRFPHPYNTYLIDGLPPGPINNPSESSIDAVLNPEDHDYHFFVAKGDGSHIFSRTLREHNRAAERYRALMRERRRAQQNAR
jgi:UPF0755 protein